MRRPARRWELIVWCALTLVAELALLLILATGATLLIMSIRFYYGPWADPPGTDELHVALQLLAVAVAAIHTVVRWRRGTVPA